jgi:hypothetical protein
MALKTVIENTEGLDEAVAALYIERDGKFVLDIEGVDDHPEVANLRNAYARTKEGQTAAKAKAAELEAQIKELQAGAPDTAAVQAQINSLKEQLAAKETEAGEWRGKYTGVTRDQSLQSALQQAGVIEPAFVKAATAMLSGMVKLGEDGTAYVDQPNNMGPKVLGDYVKGWAATEGKAFVDPGRGGGAQGNDGKKNMGGKIVAASELETMSPQEKAAYFKANPGVTVEG